jgi:hypothetical protein
MQGGGYVRMCTMNCVSSVRERRAPQEAQRWMRRPLIVSTSAAPARSVFNTGTRVHENRGDRTHVRPINPQS